MSESISIVQVNEAHRLALLEKLDSCTSDLLMVEVSGANFAPLHRNLQAPFDDDFASIMANLAMIGIREMGARCAYGHGDKITFVLHREHADQKLYKDGVMQTIASSIASIMTLRLNLFLSDAFRTHNPYFEAKVWSLPYKKDIADTLLYREMDHIKMSVYKLGLKHLKREDVAGKSMMSVIQKLTTHGIHWTQMPERYRRGFWIQRQLKEGDLKYKFLEGHAYLKDINNRIAFVFDGEEGLVSKK